MNHFIRSNGKLIVVATVCLTAGMATPALAGGVVPFARNADKVDGKHAVRAGASVSERAGKLVATSGTTGRLPGNIIGKVPDSETLDGLDSSAFLRGVSVKMRKGADFSVARNNFATGTVDCLPGEQATGGGAYPTNNVFFPQIAASFPVPNAASFGSSNTDTVATGWRVWVANTDQGGSTAPTVTMTPYVLCLR
jgi:hypothetical protein